jgi:hypothetical protein
MKFDGFETLAIHAGQEPDAGTGAVVVPIYQTSTYAQDGVGGMRQGYEYSRTKNPTRTALEECLAALESGARGLGFASGMAAEDTLLRTVLSPGDHIIIPGDAYGGTFRLISKVVERWGASIEAKDRYTAGHCERVAEYACLLAEAVGFEGRDLTWFRMGGFLHDVGKTAVPVEVLNKPGKLTDEEWAVMKMIGTVRVRCRCRIRAAVSYPSRPPSFTSNRMTPTSSSRRSSSRPT